MHQKISVVINTFNESEKLSRALLSVKWADEVIVCDMFSKDKTVDVASKMGAKVFLHKKEEFVERARNFAVSKASNEWVFILDPDEEVPSSLGKRLKEIAAKTKQINYVKVPRKNLIFGHFMKASMWWPDYNIRFFKKGKVTWENRIHLPPKASGEGIDLPAEEKYAIVHHHYRSISEYLERMIRYSGVQAEELKNQGYTFDWRDTVKKPLSEFLSRFFANRGFEDGLHGFTLSALQAFSFLIVYLRVWEMESFKEGEVNLKDFKQVSKEAGFEIDYWTKESTLPKNTFRKILQKIRNRI